MTDDVTAPMTTTVAPHGVGGRRIRVLWLVKGLGAGGAERLLVSLARVADHDRYDYAAAYLLPHKDAFRPALEAAGVTTHCLGVTSSRDMGWPWRLRRLLAQERFDVVHVHSPIVAGVARVMVRSLRPGRRPVIVSTEHNSWQSYLWPTRLLNASLHRWDRHRFAVSAQAKDSMWRPWRRDVEVLVHGVVLDDYRNVRDRRAEERQRLRIDEDAVVVTTVANLRREKGYPELLAAAEVVLAQEPGTVFLAAGQGALRQALHADHARRRLGKGFRFLGQVDDVPALLAASDVFVLPSRFEGTPIAIMETLCVGLPIVATSVGGIPEEVTHGVEGMLVPPRNAKALAASLLSLVREPETRDRMAEMATRRGAAFDIRTAIGRMEQVYADLVSLSPAGSGKPVFTPPSP
ncbi:MAG: glycosyltransferase [Actinomycetes bacterium]